MASSFGEALRRLREEKGFTQQQVADRLHVDRVTVTRWEMGHRTPDIATVSLLAEALGVDTAMLIDTAEEPSEVPNILLVDDVPVILEGGVRTLQEAIPKANVVAYRGPSDVIRFVKENPVALIFLDIELGQLSGIDLCRELLLIRPRTNVIYLTWYPEYSLDAWGTGASGFLLKPLEADDVRRELSRLRYPVKGLL